MERIEAFEKMLAEIQVQYAHEKAQMEALRAAGKEKSATFRQYMGNRLLYAGMLELYRKYGLLDSRK